MLMLTGLLTRTHQSEAHYYCRSFEVLKERLSEDRDVNLTKYLTGKGLILLKEPRTVALCETLQGWNCWLLWKQLL